MDYSIKKPKIKIKETAPPKQVKIAFVGDPGVGKSSIVNYSIEDERIVSPVPQTNLVDISFKKIRLNPNAVINYSMWDFSGKNDSIRIRTELYPEFHAIAYCFDLNNKSSFTNLETWVKEVHKYGGDQLVPICLGLKSDLSKVIDFKQIQDFCSKHKMNYFEISIKDLSAIKGFFVKFGQELYEYVSKKK